MALPERTPSESERDLRAIYERTGKPIFVQEWGDYWNAQLDVDERTAFLKQIYAVLDRLRREGVLIGFNYWGGWDNTVEASLLKRSADLS